MTYLESFKEFVSIYEYFCLYKIEFKKCVGNISAVINLEEIVLVNLLTNLIEFRSPKPPHTKFRRQN